ncbi:MAG: FAD-binding protein, partial [Chloroflexi bacterium]
MSEHWSNWSGSIRCAPQAIATPQSERELIARIKDSRHRTVRVAGSGHSFVPLCASDGLLISLDGLHGVVSADAQARQATIRAGTKIYQLGEPLMACGLALENQGDIDR